MGARLDGESIQQMLFSTTARRMLRDQVKALLSPSAVLERCYLRDARFKPGRKLTAYLDLVVRVGATKEYRVRPMTVTWESNNDGDRQTCPAPGGGGAPWSGGALPEMKLMADSAEHGMRIRVSQLDARFIQLVRLSDPRHAGAMLADAYASANAGPRKRRIHRYTVTSVRYRPGKRHVLRYDPLDPPNEEAVFAKLYTNESGAQLFGVANRAADWLAEQGDGVHAVRPLAYIAEDGVVLYPRVLGAPLSNHMRCPSEGRARCLERTGAALYALHRLPGTVSGPLEVRNFATEIEAIERASSHLAVLGPRMGRAVEALLDRAKELHERLPQEPPTFTHRDFKSEHVWVTPAELTLIDFDRAHLADPAVDVGTFLADLQWWHATYDLPGMIEAQQRFLAGYVPSAPIERWVRARLYEAIKLVKMTIVRIHLFERDWASRTARLVNRAQAAMDDLQRILGLPVRVCRRDPRPHRSASERAGKGRRREKLRLAS